MMPGEAIGAVKRDALINRIMREDPRCDREVAFRMCVLRRWFMRTGPGDYEFRTEDGKYWAFTRRGNVVAGDECCICPSSGPDEFGNRDEFEDPRCPRHGEAR
jgi:hypothetical protein